MNFIVRNNRIRHTFLLANKVHWGNSVFSLSTLHTAMINLMQSIWTVAIEVLWKWGRFYDQFIWINTEQQNKILIKVFFYLLFAFLTIFETTTTTKIFLNNAFPFRLLQFCVVKFSFIVVVSHSFFGRLMCIICHAATELNG